MIKRSSSGSHLDENVYLTMGGLCLVALLVLAFRYTTRRDCSPVAIKVSGLSFTKGALLTFQAQTKSEGSFEWNFGDGTIVEEYDPATQHTYAAPGRYTVSVTVN